MISIWECIRTIAKEKGKDLAEDQIEEVYDCLDCIIIEEDFAKGFEVGYSEVKRQINEGKLI